MNIEKTIAAASLSGSCASQDGSAAVSDGAGAIKRRSWAQVASSPERPWATAPAVASTRVVDSKSPAATPHAGPLAQLLREFSPEQVEKRFPTLDDARKVLKGQARAKGYSQAAIHAWLISDNTLIQLIEKHESWLGEIPPGEGSDAVALHFVARGHSLMHLPSHLLSYRVCSEVLTSESSGLGERTAAETHFAALPREVLEIIAADASDTFDEAQAVLGALARVQQVDDKVARTWASDPLSQKRMQKENPGLGPLGQLLRDFRPWDASKFMATLDDARAVLRGQARAKGYSEAEINAWLTSDDALIQLIEAQEPWRNYSWLGSIPPGQGSDAVALHFVARGCSLDAVPSHLRSYRVCLEVTRASDSLELPDVPAAHRTPELIRAAVSKHPDAMCFLEDAQRTIELYELAGERADFDTFRKLPVTQQVAADPRYQAVLARLQKQAAPA
jgi:hypothetical protein